MQFYITKNNQQLGPFNEAKVLEMLGNGQLAPDDLAIRQGDQEWRKLGVFYPQTKINVEPKLVIQPLAQASPAKKSKKGLLLGCGGFLVIGFLVLSILGFLAYRNLRPADSTENLPDSVNKLKLNNRYPPKGNIWGTETEFVGIYSNEAKTQTVIYLMTIYSNEQAAKDALKSELARTCKSGEKPMNFSFTSKSGTVASEGATCAVPLYIQKDNKLVSLGGPSASVDTLVTFAENLPFNEGTQMKKKE